MARSRTLTNLLLDVRQRTNNENSQSVTDPEITEYINQSIAELYDLLLSMHGQEYFVTSSTITTAANTSAYTLPADFYKLLGVEVTIGGNTFDMDPYMFAERNKYKIAGYWTPDTPLAYRLRGANINFIPNPQAVYTVTLWYVPTATRLASGTDAFDGINGWEEYVVCDAGAKILEKGDYDSSALRSRVMVLAKRITDLAGERDAGKPEKVTDIFARSSQRWRTA